MVIRVSIRSLRRNQIGYSLLLSDEEYLEVEAHVEDCEVCQDKIDELLAQGKQISHYTDDEILRLLRAGYTLSDKKERELIQRYQKDIDRSLDTEGRTNVY